MTAPLRGHAPDSVPKLSPQQAGCLAKLVPPGLPLPPPVKRGAQTGAQGAPPPLTPLAPGRVSPLISSHTSPGPGFGIQSPRQPGFWDFRSAVGCAPASPWGAPSPGNPHRSPEPVDTVSARPRLMPPSVSAVTWGGTGSSGAWELEAPVLR